MTDTEPHAGDEEAIICDGAFVARNARGLQMLYGDASSAPELRARLEAIQALERKALASMSAEALAAALERAEMRAAQLRAAKFAEQIRWASRRDAMELRFVARILNRRGSTDDRMLSWKTTIDRFIKIICCNLNVLAKLMGPIPVKHLPQLQGAVWKPSKTGTALA